MIVSMIGLGTLWKPIVLVRSATDSVAKHNLILVVASSACFNYIMLMSNKVEDTTTRACKMFLCTRT